MNLTEEQNRELKEKAEALMKWMAENLHPHHLLVIENTSFQLLEGVVSSHTQRFIKP